LELGFAPLGPKQCALPKRAFNQSTKKGTRTMSNLTTKTKASSKKNRRNKKQPKEDIYTRVTSQIVEAL